MNAPNVDCSPSKNDEGDPMQNQRREEEISTTWMIVLVLLTAILIVGIVLYFKMSAPLNEPIRRRVGSVQMPISALGVPSLSWTAFANSAEN